MHVTHANISFHINKYCHVWCHIVQVVASGSLWIFGFILWDVQFCFHSHGQATYRGCIPNLLTCCMPNVDFTKGIPECWPGAPGRERGSSAGHEKFYMNPQIFNFFPCNCM